MLENNESLQPELFSLAPDGSGEIEKIGGEEYKKEVKEPSEEEKLDKFVSENQVKYPCRVNPVRLPYLKNAAKGRKVESDEDRELVAKDAVSEYLKGKPARDKYEHKELEAKFLKDQLKLEEYLRKMKEIWEEYKLNPPSETVDTIAPEVEKKDGGPKTSEEDDKPEYTGYYTDWDNKREDRIEQNRQDNQPDNQDEQDK